MHTSENVEAIVEFTTVDHVEDLTPYKDVEDKSTKNNVGIQCRASWQINIRVYLLEFKLRGCTIDSL